MHHLQLECLQKAYYSLLTCANDRSGVYEGKGLAMNRHATGKRSPLYLRGLQPYPPFTAGPTPLTYAGSIRWPDAPHQKRGSSCKHLRRVVPHSGTSSFCRGSNGPIGGRTYDGSMYFYRSTVPLVPGSTVLSGTLGSGRGLHLIARSVHSTGASAPLLPVGPPLAHAIITILSSLWCFSFP